VRVIQQLEFILNASEKTDTNHRIAEQLLFDLPDLNKMTVEDVALRCNVSSSTLMRFFKANGYNSFGTFVSAVQVAISDYEYRSVYIPPAAKSEAVETEQFLDLMIQNMERLRKDVSRTSLEIACKAMYESERILFVSCGPMSGLHVTVLRTALVLTRKKTELIESFVPIKPESLNLTKNDFILMMKAESPAAHMLDRLIVEAKEKGSKTLAISNVKSFSGWEKVDFPFGFKGYQAYTDLFAMQAILAMLSTTYRSMYKDEIRNAINR